MRDISALMNSFKQMFYAVWHECTPAVSKNHFFGFHFEKLKSFEAEINVVRSEILQSEGRLESAMDIHH